jgi:hypothetical protein
MPMIKSRNITENRHTVLSGLDFSIYETLDPVASTPGKSLKFRGGTTMGYYNATYGGIKILGDLFATTLSTGDAGKSYARLLHIEGSCTGSSESAAGALVAVCTRSSSYPFGTAGTGGWGGAEDATARFYCYNSAANTPLKGGMRTLNVYCRNYAGAQIANMYAGKFDCDDRGTGSTASSAVIQTLTVAQRVNGINSTTANILVVEDNSQGSLSGAGASGTAMVRIRSTQPIATGARHTGILFETTGSGSGWTNAFSFQTAAGKEGFTALADAAHQGNVNGYIKVYDVATGQTLYLNCYDAVPS